MKYVLSIVMCNGDVIKSLNTLDISSSRETAINNIDRQIKDLTNYHCFIDDAYKRDKKINDVIKEIKDFFNNNKRDVEYITKSKQFYTKIIKVDI